MTAVEITVQYERKFSDGNYGSEGLSFSMTIHSDPDYFLEDNFERQAKAMRTAVLTELAKSEAHNVASAAKRELNSPPPRQAVTAGAANTDVTLEDMPF